MGGVWVEDTKGLTPVSAYRDSEINPNTNDKVYINDIFGKPYVDLLVV